MIFGILRIFRNESSGYNPDVVKIVTKWIDTGVDHIVAVISAPLDKENTDQIIREAFINEERVSVIRINSYRASDYWSVALNEGIRFLARKFKIEESDGLLVFSNEATITNSVLEKMKTFVEQGAGVVGVKFPGFTAKSYYVPRNTCALWNFRRILLAGGFSAECDTLGGMEDYYMVKVFQSKGIFCAMIEGSGVETAIISKEYQALKVRKELQAMKEINKLLRL